MKRGHGSPEKPIYNWCIRHRNKRVVVGIWHDTRDRARAALKAMKLGEAEKNWRVARFAIFEVKGSR